MSNTQSPAPGVAAERQRFEATFAKLSPGCDFSRASNDTYANRYVQHNWQGWNAALQASAAAVPVGEIIQNPAKTHSYFALLNHGSMPPVGTKLYTAPPLPAQVQEAGIAAWNDYKQARENYRRKANGDTADQLTVTEEALTTAMDALASRTPAPGNVADWGIDTSTGKKILVYKKCSVIEDEQAELVLRLLGAPGMAGYRMRKNDAR